MKVSRLSYVPSDALFTLQPSNNMTGDGFSPRKQPLMQSPFLHRLCVREFHIPVSNLFVDFLQLQVEPDWDSCQGY